MIIIISILRIGVFFSCQFPDKPHGNLATSFKTFFLFLHEKESPSLIILVNWFEPAVGCVMGTLDST